jgi:endonuclease/exonuclease/phosphatase family metal-dependent hydrolase
VETVTVTPENSLAAGNDGTDGRRLRLLHWNIHSWRDDTGQPNQDAVGKLIATAEADVISLVEVNEPWGLPAALTELAEHAGYSWIFSPAVQMGADTPQRGYGNALLSRLPLEAVQQWQLTWPQVAYDGTEPSEARTVVLGRVRLPAGPVWVGSTHLPSTRPEATLAAARQLATLSQRLDAPWLICGDFNIPAAGWASAAYPMVVAPDPAVPTHPAGEPVHPIDYCVASPGMDLAAQVLATPGSDHLPVLVDARIGSRQQPAGGGR